MLTFLNKALTNFLAEWHEYNDNASYFKKCTRTSNFVKVFPFRSDKADKKDLVDLAEKRDIQQHSTLFPLSPKNEKARFLALVLKELSNLYKGLFSRDFPVFTRNSA